MWHWSSRKRCSRGVKRRLFDLCFTRGQFWPSGIVVACVCVCVCVTQPRVGAAEVESLFKEYECCCVMGSVTGHCIPVVWPLHGFRRVLVLWWVLTWNQSWANDHSLSWKGQEFITYIHFQNIHVYRQQLWEQDSPVRWLVNCQTRVAVIIGPEWKIR